ncbi:6997_t:CDS:2 [Acaulospora morrowiae]|uniref:6997_t:CDS:1 n=1 Tax=Acaulospora morrowiae TaxID=94023 RepID=A0A9N9ADW1_9GLOM|nr:6997_t:CDS:2 [Acaulospora morrowiae]
MDSILIQKSFKSKSTNFIFEENNSVNNGEGSLTNQLLDSKIQFDDDPSNNDKENEIVDYYEKKSIDHSNS